MSTITAGTTTRLVVRRARPRPPASRAGTLASTTSAGGEELPARERLAQRRAAGSRQPAPARRVPARAPREGYGCACGSASHGYASGCDRRGPRSRALADPDRRQPPQAGRPRPGPQGARDLREGARRGRGRRLADEAARAARAAPRGRAGDAARADAAPLTQPPARDRAGRLASQRVRLGGRARRLAGRERAARTSAAAMPATSPASQSAPVTPSLTAAPDGHAARDDDRAAAGERLDRREAEALALGDEAGDVAGAHPARHLVRARTPPAKRTAAAMPSSRARASSLDSAAARRRRARASRRPTARAPARTPRAAAARFLRGMRLPA